MTVTRKEGECQRRRVLLNFCRALLTSHASFPRTITRTSPEISTLMLIFLTAVRDEAGVCFLPTFYTAVMQRSLFLLMW
jgi:hypothetical protein